MPDQHAHPPAGAFVIGTAVFALGVLAGAGIAAWIIPPV
jgi:hypothetical protein